MTSNTPGPLLPLADTLCGDGLRQNPVVASTMDVLRRLVGAMRQV